MKDDIAIQQRMMGYLETVEHYMWNNCDKKGNIVNCSNLTEAEQAGLDEIKVGVKTKGWIIYSSDKSGKIVLDTKENFLECMREHFSGDREVGPDEVRKSEKMINIHSRAWCRIFSIGEAAGRGQPRRCGRALVNNFSTIPTLQGLRKDHKSNMDGDQPRVQSYGH